MMRRGLILGLAWGLAGCSSPVLLRDAGTVSASQARNVAKVRVVEGDQKAPPHTANLIPIDAYGCVDPLAGEASARADALGQLRVKAIAAGGNAVVGVTYATQGAPTLGTPCSQTMTASGVAARIGGR